MMLLQKIVQCDQYNKLLHMQAYQQQNGPTWRKIYKIRTFLP